MSSIKILAILLILGGGLGLAYGSFSFTKETHETKIGPLELSVKDKQTVQIPQWLGAAAIAGGALLLLFDRKQSRSDA
jgi:TRAP-type C4-dicarboxylate transport system permease small subunit